MYFQPVYRQNKKAMFFPVVLTIGMFVAGNLFAQQVAPAKQAPPPPPPPSVAPGTVQPVPAPTPPPPPPAAAEPGLSPENERDIVDSIEQGKAALKNLDLGAAQMFMEQAFSKCDSHGIQGPLLARVYMALGALFVGYLQQIPQGAEFMKMALAIDQKAEPDQEIANVQVNATLELVRQSLGIVVPKAEAAPAPASTGAHMGGFWIMKHEPVTTAKRMYPLGLYVETNPMVAIKEVRLYFRLPSDRRYQVFSMRRNGNQYGMLIECGAISLLDPKALFYYIEVVGGDGSIVGRVGDVANPTEIKMVSEEAFTGVQPTLPGLPDPVKCNPDQAAPCPPWDPHCKDTPCVTLEDCLTGQICREGFCTDTEQGGKRIGPVGVAIFGGLGMGAGVAMGTEEDAVYRFEFENSSIPLDSGFSPSWMFTRLMAGYFVLDNLLIGAFVRFQHINEDQYSVEGREVEGFEDPDMSMSTSKQVNYGMKIAGLQLRNRKGYPNDWRGPMWGPTIAWFFFGGGEWLGPGQVIGPDGELAPKQGFRAYARFEFNVFGAMYHEVKLTGKKPDFAMTDEDIQDGDDQATVKRQHVSGMEGLGLGVGALYGVHKYVDLGVEIMYDLMFPDVAHNLDFQLQLAVHF